MQAPDRAASSPSDETPLLEPRRLEEAGIRALERRYEPEESIFMRGDPADRLYLLLDGVVRVYKPYGGYGEATIALLKDHGGFGEFDLFGKNSQSSSAEALSLCRVASVRKEDLRLAMERQPGLALGLFSMFSERLRHSERAMEVLLHRKVVPRLAALLPELARNLADPGGEDAEPVIPLTHSEVAGLAASTREAVSKALGQLEHEGLLELGKRRITIKDQPELAKRATGLVS